MKKPDPNILFCRIFIVSYAGLNPFLKLMILFLLLMILPSGRIYAQPNVVLKTSGFATTGTTVTVPHNLSAATGNNFLLLAGISTRDASITGLAIGEPSENVTFAGEAMTFLGFENSNSAAMTAIFSLVAPPLVNGNLVITFSGVLSYAAIAGVITFSNVDQFNPVGTFASFFGNNSGPASLTINSTNSKMLIFDVISVDNKMITNPSDRLSFWNVTTAGNVKGAGSARTGEDSSTTLNWTLGGSTRWSISGIPINPVKTADLRISNVVNISTPYRGQTITYTLTAFNDGPDEAPNVTVDNILPAELNYQSHTVTSGTYNFSTGIWNAGTLNSGSSATLTISATVLNTAGTITNSATIAGEVFDPAAANTATSIVTVCQAGGIAPLFKN